MADNFFAVKFWLTNSAGNAAACLATSSNKNKSKVAVKKMPAVAANIRDRPLVAIQFSGKRHNTQARCGWFSRKEIHERISEAGSHQER